LLDADESDETEALILTALEERVAQSSVGNNIILQYIALFGAYYISTILRI
jgi:hypothetical protein